MRVRQTWLAAVLAIWTSQAFAFSNGITGLTTDPNGCNNCHTGGNFPVVNLLGPAQVAPGSTGTYVLELEEDSPQIYGGLDAAASDGTLSVGGPFSSNTQLLGDEVTHTSKKIGDGTKVRFSFLWTAPTTGGPFTLRAWGNLVNGNNVNSGDAASFASLSVALAPIEDSLILPVTARKITIPSSSPAVTKVVPIKVRNADSIGAAPQNVQLALSGTDCPAGITLGTPDFDSATPAEQDTVTLQPGQTKTAKVSVTATQSAVTITNKKAPLRCTATYNVASTSPGSIDPSPSNNTMALELNFLDNSDILGASPNEVVAKSTTPFVMTIPISAIAGSKSRSFKVVNADSVALSVGMSIDVSSCPWLTVGPIDMDRTTPAVDSTVSLGPGKTATVKVTFLADPSLVSTPNKKAPLRCIGSVNVQGPAPDGQPSNDSTPLLIDVVDKNL